MGEQQGLNEFMTEFQTEEDCIRFLYQLKWPSTLHLSPLQPFTSVYHPYTQTSFIRVCFLWPSNLSDREYGDARKQDLTA
jgi:hypothetical protein